MVIPTDTDGTTVALLRASHGVASNGIITIKLLYPEIANHHLLTINIVVILQESNDRASRSTETKNSVINSDDALVAVPYPSFNNILICTGLQAASEGEPMYVDQ